MKIIITGSTGVVGSQLTPQLIKEGHDVFVSDARFMEGGDVFSSFDVLNKLGKMPGVFLNLGAVTTGEARDAGAISRVIMVNAIVPAIIALMRKRNGINDKFIYFSSTVVFWVGEKRDGIIDENTSVDLEKRAPKVSELIEKIKNKFNEMVVSGLDDGNIDFFASLNQFILEIFERELSSGDESIFIDKQIYPYKISKWLGEALLRENENVTIIRFPTVYGPGDLHPERALPLAIKNLLTIGRATYPNAIFDYLYTLDIVDALSVFLQNPNTYPRLLHFASGRGVTPEDFIQSVNFAYPPSINNIEIIKNKSLVIPPTVSNETICKLLGRNPTEFSVGIKSYFEWLNFIKK